ncbi:MAG: anti-sigma factor [Planctomycetota bacterium]|nr:anti-sigma factor [Planctomycetota bacterium]
MNNDVNHNDSGLAMPPDELFDLLADRATFGLDDDETIRLDQLLRENSWVREDCLDETAAVLAAGFAASETEAMPEDALGRIRRGVHAAIDADLETAPAPAGRIEASTEGGVMSWLGWIAAAAALGVAIIIARPVDRVVPGSEAELVAWIEQHPSAVHWDWEAGLVQPDEDASGMVTFDPATQEGFMLIKGLEPNDPRREQYQLWIWDQEREPDPDNPTPLADNVHPVDGGVFDVDADGEAIIPIDAKLTIGKPYLFAVTVERPGGVAKSDKSQVPIIAQPKPDA